MASDREKEREAELEGAMYTNCLLLGLDPAVLGARIGNFRHSNPRLGEQLLYFLLSALRGPAQSAKAKDFLNFLLAWFNRILLLFFLIFTRRVSGFLRSFLLAWLQLSSEISGF